MSTLMALWQDRPRLHWRDLFIGIAVIAFMSVVFQSLWPINHPELYFFTGLSMLAIIRAFEKQR